ncbi:hypothetical protein Syun_020686 [Stephania yunnanensis]|uniref:Uncharacterized protein n=1 Tax=Stephania yunnanensis TaxID=152371 RepID=A0AAP0NPX4_9MAGN
MENNFWPLHQVKRCMKQMKLKPLKYLFTMSETNLESGLEMKYLLQREKITMFRIS